MDENSPAPEAGAENKSRFLGCLLGSIEWGIGRTINLILWLGPSREPRSKGGNRGKNGVGWYRWILASTYLRRKARSPTPADNGTIARTATIK